MFGQAPYSFPPVPQQTPPLNAEAKQAAFQRTEETLKVLLQICKRLEMPPSVLPQILPQMLEIYGTSAREVLLEKEEGKPFYTTRVPMEMRSLDTDRRPVRIRPGEVYEVLARPQWGAYRVEEISIEGDPSQWLVHDITVGGRSQIGLNEPISGSQFRKGGIMSELRLATCQTTMDFVLRVEYVGTLPEGEMFEACLLGTAAM